MNFRRKLARVLALFVLMLVVTMVTIALMGIPVGAFNRLPVYPDAGKVLNAPPTLPTMINYQGYLTDDEGNPVEGTVSMVFSICSTPTGDTAVWTETQSVTVNEGIFNVLLGSSNPIYPSDLMGTSYLGIAVGGDPEMTPRQRLVSVPYAIRSITANLAANAENLDGMDSTDFALVAHNHDSDYVNVTGDTMTGTLNLPMDGLVAGTDQFVLKNGKVGIGTNTPGMKLHVVGGSSVGIYSDSDAAYGVMGMQNTSGNYGYIGHSSYGVYGKHDFSGNYGYTGSSIYGVYGIHDSSGNYGGLGSSGYGVYGYSGSGYGVYGGSSSGSGVWGGSSSGNGVYGTSGSGYGLYGSSTSSYAIVGSSISGSGVWGGSSGSGYGVHGVSSSGYGVYGYCTNGEGVYGQGPTGVYGHGTGTYNFYAGGTATTDYGTFTGAHEVKLANEFPEDITPGMIVSVTGENQVRTAEDEISYSSTLSTVQLADTPSDKKVLGVLVAEASLPEDHWYEAGEGERFGIVNALGEGRVWVTNINSDIEAGDYITTSAIAGYGQKQDDDLLHSYTLGKAIEDIDWSEVLETVEFNGQTFKAYPIAVVYTSG